MYTKAVKMHFIALVVFIALAIITLRELLFSSGIFQYRDLVWASDIQTLMSKVSYTLNLDGLRRIIYLGPFLGLINLLGLSSAFAQKLLFLLTRIMIGFFAYFAVFNFLMLKTTKNLTKRVLKVRKRRGGLKKGA